MVRLTAPGHAGVRISSGFMAILSVLLFSSCDISLFDFVASSALDTRLEDRNTFNLLTAADRELVLGAEYSFIVVSDTHISHADTRNLAQLSSVIGDASFVVITGDVTNAGSREEVAGFVAIAKNLPVPCYPVLGNHDMFSGNWAVWKELIGSSCYRVEGASSSTTLFFLDSANEYLGNAQLTWLEDGLRTAKGHVFVFSHANLFMNKFMDIGHADVAERARVIALLKGRCDAMFMGHLHKDNYLYLGGVQYITLDAYRDTRSYYRVYVSPAGARYEKYYL
jgi:predicted phosphodiesterase